MGSIMKSFVAIVLAGYALMGLAAGTAVSQEQDAQVGPTVEAPSPDAARLDTLTESERRLLERGEYDKNEIVGGGLLGSIVGFGSGHVVQGRYAETGWIYTAGEGAGLAVWGFGALGCVLGDQGDDLEDVLGSFECMTITAGVGLGGFLAFKLAEIVDVWAHPAVQIARFRKLKARTTPTSPRSRSRSRPCRAAGAQGSRSATDARCRRRNRSIESIDPTARVRAIRHVLRPRCSRPMRARREMGGS